MNGGYFNSCLLETEIIDNKHKIIKCKFYEGTNIAIITDNHLLSDNKLMYFVNGNLFICKLDVLEYIHIDNVTGIDNFKSLALNGINPSPILIINQGYSYQTVLLFLDIRDFTVYITKEQYKSYSVKLRRYKSILNLKLEFNDILTNKIVNRIDITNLVNIEWKLRQFKNIFKKLKL